MKNSAVKKIAIYDFCETIVDFQTADAFVKFIYKSNHSKRAKNIELIRGILNRLMILRILDKLGAMLGFIPNKRMLLNELKGMNKMAIENYARIYYEKDVKPHIIKAVIDRLEEEKNDGFEIVILSASYEPFLKIFKKEYDIDCLICNEFDYRALYFTGKMKRRDCYGKEKIHRLLEIYPSIQCKSTKTRAYSDSYSDIPLLTYVDEGYVISHKSTRKWVKRHKLFEIVWE